MNPTLKSLILHMFRQTPRDTNMDIVYVVGKDVHIEYEEPEQEFTDLFAKAGQTTADGPTASTVLSIECEDGDLYFLQVSSDGNVAVVTNHEIHAVRDMATEEDTEVYQDAIDDTVLADTHISGGHIHLPMAGLDGNMAYSLVNLSMRVTQILTHLRKEEEATQIV